MTSIRHSNRLNLLLGLVLCATVFVGLLAVYLPTRLDHERSVKDAAAAQCLAKWATQTSQRSALVSRYNRQAQEAQELLDEVAPGSSLHALRLSQYRAAQAALTEALANNPPPIFTCTSPGTDLGPILTQSVPVPAPTTTTETVPGPTTTRTKISTAPGRPGATISVPGSVVTVTRFVPGPPGRTRTVTKTVSPPSCLQIPVPSPPCVLN